MANHYSWNPSREGVAYRLPGPNHLGWWAAVAMILSIILHLFAFFALDQMKIVFNFEAPPEIQTQPIDVRQVEVSPLDLEPISPPETLVKPPTTAAALLDEVEILTAIPKNQEVDIAPDILEASYAIQLTKPLQEGSPEVAAFEIETGLGMQAELPDFGRAPETIAIAEMGQITVDPGEVQVDDSEIGKLTEALIRQGANGKAEKGTLDGVTSLDSLLDLPPNLLVSKKTMLPSDLLFEFNSHELRESAKIGLMKLGLLMDRNPELYCWIEGHTDLVGGDEFNLNLSIKRAESVKAYLVNSLRMAESKIVTRGLGRSKPIVAKGSKDEQSINRRVEVRMRTSLPNEAQMTLAPQNAPTATEPAASPQAILVKPRRAIPIEELEAAPPAKKAPVSVVSSEEEIPPLKAKLIEEPTASNEIPEQPPLKAKMIEEPVVPPVLPIPKKPAPKKAVPVELAPEPRKAIPVEEEAPVQRALPEFLDVPQAEPVEQESPVEAPRAQAIDDE
jgi:OmpA-OmpF porin, OOP family